MRVTLRSSVILQVLAASKPTHGTFLGGFLGVADGPIPDGSTFGTAQQARYITLQFHLLRRKPQKNSCASCVSCVVCVCEAQTMKPFPTFCCSKFCRGTLQGSGRPFRISLPPGFRVRETWSNLSARELFFFQDPFKIDLSCFNLGFLRSL